MRRLGLLLSAVLVITILGVSQGAQAGSGDDATTAEVGPEVTAALEAGEPAHVVVMLDAEVGPTADVDALRADADRAQERLAENLSGGGGAAVTYEFETIPAVTATVESQAALARLASAPNVRRIDVDTSGGTGQLANTVPIIGADDLHGLGVSGEGTTVAVLDSGVDTDHPDLASSVVHQACFGFNFSNPGVGFCPNGSDRQTGPGAAEDDAGHGTHVSGIVTSDGVVSSVGVAPDADLVSIKVLDNCSFAGCFYTFTEITAALDYIVAHPELGVDVINMSLGTGALFSGDCDDQTSWLMAGAAAVSNLRAAGVLPFASAGNEGSTTAMTAPACLSGVVSVAATNTSDAITSFSNTDTSTDMLAPGNAVVSDARGGGTTTASGTSMASPAAAGCAALLHEAVPTAGPATVETAMENTGTPIARGSASFPRINCAAAAEALEEPPAGPTVSIGDAAIVEGNGTKARAIKFAVTLSERATNTVTVTWDTGGGTATEGRKQLPGVDYKGPTSPKTITFKPSARTGLTPARKFVSIPVYPDTEVEGTETFNVALTNVTGGYTVGDGAAVGTILDDEGTSGLLASIGDASVHEGNEGKRTVGLVVTLSHQVNEEILVDYTVSGSTASCAKKEAPGVDCRDYGGLTRTLRFKVGSSGLTSASKLVNITIWPDGANENDESIVVTLSNPRSATAGSSLSMGLLRATGTATLIDDD